MSEGLHAPGLRAVVSTASWCLGVTLLDARQLLFQQSTRRAKQKPVNHPAVPYQHPYVMHVYHNPYTAELQHTCI